MSTTPYDRGYQAGWTEAVTRESSDGANASDANTWFAVTSDERERLVSDDDLWAYENGFGDGWKDYFTARA